MPGQPLPHPSVKTLPRLAPLSARRLPEARRLRIGAARKPEADGSARAPLRITPMSASAICHLLVDCIATVCLLLVALTPTAAAANEPSSSVESRAAAQVALRGQVPVDDYPAIQSKSDLIWAYLADRFVLADLTAAPTVQFEPFDPAGQSPAWSAWQKDWIKTHPEIWHDWSAMQPARSGTNVSVEWIDSHIDSVFPFPKHFLAFHYDGSNRIQIDPNRTFIESMQIFLDGERRGRSGQGFYSLGHEMLHYALELRGVEPKRLHHCLMLYTLGDDDTPALMQEVADHLVEHQIIAPIARLRGLRTEHSLRPCARLSDDELALVADFRKRLSVSAPSTTPAAGLGSAVAE